MPRTEDERGNGQEGEDQRGSNSLEQFLRDFEPGVERSSKANNPLFLLLKDIMDAAAQRDQLIRQDQEASGVGGRLFFYVPPVQDQSGTVFGSTRDNWDQGLEAPGVRGVRKGEEVAILLEPNNAATINSERDFNMQVFGTRRITFYSSGKLTFHDANYQEKDITAALRKRLMPTLDRIKGDVSVSLAIAQGKANGQPPRRP